MTYFDTSALRRLYVHEEGSRGMAALRAKHPGAVRLTRFGFAELANSVALAAFRNHITPEEASAIHARVQDDVAEGLLEIVDLPWRAVLTRAAELSRTHTPKLGTRSLDVLHVASALELNARHFATYDDRQARLAVTCGMKALKP